MTTFTHTCSNKCSCGHSSGYLSFHECKELYTQGILDNIAANGGVWQDPHNEEDPAYDEVEGTFNYDIGFMGAECGLAGNYANSWTDEENDELKKLTENGLFKRCGCSEGCDGWIYTDEMIACWEATSA